MKKIYSTPILTTHGSVEAITQMFGTKSRKDFLFFTGSASSPNATITLTENQGSIDGILDKCTPSTCPTPKKIGD